MGSVAGLLGGLILLSDKRWSRILCVYSIPFAAGVLLAVSFLDLLPEAIHQMGESALVYVLVAFVAGYVLEQGLDHFHHHDLEISHSAQDKSIVPLIIIGDSVHNFIDGVAIAGAYIVDPALGVIVAISTLLHEVPHEIGDFGIMLHTGFKRSQVLLFNFLSSLTTFIGVGFVIALGDQIESILGVILSISAGVFLYIASTDLLPRVTKASTGRTHKTLVFFVGIAVMVIITRLIPHNG